MKLNTLISIAVVAACPLLMAPTGVGGSLAGFSSGSQGGQSPADWGTGGQGSSQTGGQSGTGNSQSSGKSGGQGSSQHSSQSGGQSGGQHGGQSGGQGAGQTGGQSGSGNGQDSGKSGSQGSGQHSSQGDGKTDGQNSSQNQDGDQGDRSDERKQHERDDIDRSDERKQHERDDIDRSDERKQHERNDGDGGRNGSDGGDGSNGSDGGDGGDGGYTPLDPANDPQYDPSNRNDGQIPTGCADRGSKCADCVRRHEEAIQFNRTYLHVAWSISKQTHEMVTKALAFGDDVSSIHGTQGLAWQLGGRPQIEEAIANHTKVYAKKYQVYYDNIAQSLDLMAKCDADNFAVSDLYSRYGFLYKEFIKARYESAE